MPMWLNCSIAYRWAPRWLCFPVPGLWLKNRSDPRKPPWLKSRSDPRKPPWRRCVGDAAIEGATRPIGVITVEGIDDHFSACLGGNTIGRLPVGFGIKL